MTRRERINAVAWVTILAAITLVTFAMWAPLGWLPLILTIMTLVALTRARGRHRAPRRP